MDYFDLAQPTGSLAASFAAAEQVKFLVVSFTSDWLYPSYHSKELVTALTVAGADVTYLDIQSSWGHDAFLLEVETMTRLLGSFLDRLVREERVVLPEQETGKQEDKKIDYRNGQVDSALLERLRSAAEVMA